MANPFAGRRVIILALLSLVAIGALAILFLNGRAQATRMPVMRQAHVVFSDLPPDARPLTLAVLSDIHIGNPATSAARLDKVVAAVKSAKPDAVVILGDFVNGDHAGDDMARPDLLEEPLARLSAPLGVFATLGNHDHWTGQSAVRVALNRAGVTVLANNAARIGPFVLAGIDDSASSHANAGLTLEKARRIGGLPIVVTHSPGIEQWLPRPVPLLLHGHTHCGQILFRIGGMRFYPAELLIGRPYPKAMRCGFARRDGILSLATAGIGTTGLSLRSGPPPDWWLLTLGPDPEGLNAPRQDPRNASAGAR